MRLFYYFFCLLFIYIPLLHSIEYIYPVAYLEDESAILYIHQTSEKSINLFQWNMLTNQTEQALWSLFNPAGLQLLSNNAGFSFIDNGRLRIKMFQKRSPKTIDFDEPIYNINTLHWIGEHVCYCSAQQGDNFSLFELHNDGTLYCLKDSNEIDCLYPQKIENQLFYIERDPSDIHYRIMETQYNHQNNQLSQVVADFQERPIVFLNMISPEEGFVVGHEKAITIDNKTALFSYYRLAKRGNDWESILLFNFNIPTCLFLYDNEQRLFESILPLLPRIVDNRIYFVDCSMNNQQNLELYYYDREIIQTHKVPTNNEMGHVFVPILCGKQICYGGTKNGIGLFLSAF